MELWASLKLREYKDFGNMEAWKTVALGLTLDCKGPCSGQGHAKA